MHRRQFLSLAGLAALSLSASAGDDSLRVALDTPSADGRPVVIPAGVHLVSRTLVLPAGHPGLRGAGADRTVLRAASGLVGPVVVVARGGPVSVADLTVERGERRLRLGARPVPVVRVG